MIQAQMEAQKDHCSTTCTTCGMDCISL